MDMMHCAADGSDTSRGGGRWPAAPSLRTLARLRRLLARLNQPDRPGGLERAPGVVRVCGPVLTPARRLVAVPGSFNPPHRAHVALLEAGAAAYEADAAVFVLSVHTVDKERVTGMLLEDRLWLLCRILETDVRLATPGGQGAGIPARWPGSIEAGMRLATPAPPPGTEDRRRGLGRAPAGLHTVPEPQPADTGVRAGTVATNQGLYVDQAAALRRLCPRLERLVFVVGFDKIVQIFDPRYYQHRDAALDALFAQAELAVAPRDDATGADLDRLLSQPENRRYAPRIRLLALDPQLASISSTRIRAAIASCTGIEHLVPEVVREFIRATSCYAAPDGAGPYGARVQALERLQPA